MSKWHVVATNSICSVLVTVALVHSPLASLYIQQRDGLVLHLMLKYMTYLAMLTAMALLSSNVLTQSEIYHLRKLAKTHSSVASYSQEPFTLNAITTTSYMLAVICIAGVTFASIPQSV